MTVNAAIEANLPFLRTEAEARMTSRATVRRMTDRTEQNEGNGHEDPVWDVVHTGLPCRIPATDARRGERVVSIGGVEFDQSTGTWHCPWNTTDLDDGDYVEMTSGQWAGRVMRITTALVGEQMTARRLPVEDVDRPEEWT